MASPGNGFTEAGRTTSVGDDSAAGAIELTASELKAKLRKLTDEGKARVSEWESGLEDGIREKPIQALLIAAAVGTALGLLLSPRIHDAIASRKPRTRRAK